MKKNKTKRLGAEIFESLEEFSKALQEGAPLESFTFRCVDVNIEAISYDPIRIKDTRALLRASQAVFARFLGVSVQTVRAWEQGENVPSDMAKRFMDEIRHDPDYWRARLRQVVVAKKRLAGSNSK